jgi:hypothetical protein
VSGLSSPATAKPDDGPDTFLSGYSVRDGVEEWGMQADLGHIPAASDGSNIKFVMLSLNISSGMEAGVLPPHLLSDEPFALNNGSSSFGTLQCELTEVPAQLGAVSGLIGFGGCQPYCLGLSEPQNIWGMVEYIFILVGVQSLPGLRQRLGRASSCL